VRWLWSRAPSRWRADSKPEPSDDPPPEVVIPDAMKPRDWSGRLDLPRERREL